MFIDVLQKVANLKNIINTEHKKRMCTSYSPALTSIISSYFTDFDTVYLFHFKQGHALQCISYVLTNWHGNRSSKPDIKSCFEKNRI